MTDPRIERALEEYLEAQRLSRRRFLGRAGGAAFALSGLSTVIAACGGVEGTQQKAKEENADKAKTVSHPKEPLGDWTFSNWPLYMDKKMLKQFDKKFGGKVKYIEDINDNYEFFGKVRQQLENVIERGVVVSMGSKLDLGEWLPKPSVPQTGARILMLEELEREHIIKTLELTGWRVSGERGAAKLLGLKATTLDARMKKLGITRKGASASNIS